MKPGPILNFFGSKYRGASKYPAPRFPTVVEPFAGSAGYAVRYGSDRAVLVEKDPQLAAMWRWFLRCNRYDILALPLLEPGEKVGSLPVCEEARTLIGFTVNCGTCRPRQTLSSWAVAHGPACPTFWGPARRLRLAEQAERMHDWRLIEGSYEEAPDIEATWFIDPPYQKLGHHYRYGSDGIQYTRLADWCRSRRGQVIVCEMDGADWLPFTPCYNAFGAMSKRSPDRRYNEVVWTNDST